VKVGYYPGCSLEGSAREFDISVRIMCAMLEIELVEIEDWSCCGASAAHNLNRLLGVALPARNLALAERQGLDEVLAPCAACSNRLITANHEMAGDAELRKLTIEAIEMDYGGSVRVFNLPELLMTYGLDAIESRVTRKLDMLRVACYYGCLLVRPPKVLEFDDAENPQSMDKIVGALGADPLDWPYKVECCGGGFTMSRADIVAKLNRDILEHARLAGANAIVVSCPMCHANLDMRRSAVNAAYGTDYRMPVYYISQLVAIALGAAPKEVGVGRHFVEALSLVK